MQTPVHGVSNNIGKLGYGEVKLERCLANYALSHEDVWGSGCVALTILHVGTSCR
jgi:hypothetical protein